ncbi:hypothetical protein COO60DRAFT_677318 [Scenedesmus sp. NREL 46B-D3]|nr:hypothetical protein COO60DRAFT_677318 [Scenedesmus sp. NREL 46B-D3]
MPAADAGLSGGAAAAATAPASHSLLTGPAVPAASHNHHQQQQQPASMASLASTHDVLQHSHSILSSATAPAPWLGRRHHPAQQQQQQQVNNPAAYTRLAVRCGTAHGVFDIARQRATCLCQVCVQGVGTGGIEMMPTEFERHGGCGSFKKWKKSILVAETGRNIGSWLNQQGLIILNPSALTKKTKKRQLQATIEANRAAGRHMSAAAAAAAGMHSRQLPGAAAGMGGAVNGFGGGPGVVGWQGGSYDFTAGAAAAALGAAAQAQNEQQQQQQHHQQQHQQQQQQQQPHAAWQQSEHLAASWHSRHAHGPGTGAAPARQHLRLDSSMQPGQGLPNGQGPVGRTSSNGSRMTQLSQHSSQHMHEAAAGVTYVLPPQQRAGAAWEEQSGWEQHRHQQEYQQQQQQDGDTAQPHHAPGYGWRQHAQHQQPQPHSHWSGSGFSAGPNPGTQVEGSGVCLQHRPEGFGLVGRRVRVWWPLDREWYGGAVQAFDPMLQLHTLLYDDGDLEQLNLSEEQWELLLQQAAPEAAAAAATAAPHGAAYQHAVTAWVSADMQQQELAGCQSTELPQQQGSAPDSPASDSAGNSTDAAAAHAAAVWTADNGQGDDAAAAAAAAAAAVGTMDVDGDEQDPRAPWSGAEEEDTAWLQAAEAAAAERPLRVMWDSRTCLLRVIAAADLVQAEREMRRHQLHRWHGHGNKGRPDLHVQHCTSRKRQALLQRQGRAQTAEWQQLELAPSSDSAPSKSQHLPGQQQGSQQLLQQQVESAGQRRHHCADTEAAPQLRQLQGRPAALSTSSSEATADGQPDEQGQAAHERQAQLYGQQAVQLQQQQPQQDPQQLLQVAVSRAGDPAGYQVLVSLPGCCLKDVRIQAWDDGRLLLRASLHPAAAAGSARGAPEADRTVHDPAATRVQHDAVASRVGKGAVAGLAVHAVERLVRLPARVAASTARALMTHHGQLYVRVNDV